MKKKKFHLEMEAMFFLSGGDSNLMTMMKMRKVIISVSDPYSLNPDPDPAKNLNPDPDSGKFFSPTKKVA